MSNTYSLKQFNVGSFWKTRNGEKAEILKWDECARVVFIYNKKRGTTFSFYNESGEATLINSRENDLIEPWVELKSGIYYLCVFDSQEPIVSEKPMTKDMFSSLIACKQVEWKEGDTW